MTDFNLEIDAIKTAYHALRGLTADEFERAVQYISERIDAERKVADVPQLASDRGEKHE
jgi:hypothetical protein